MKRRGAEREAAHAIGKVMCGLVFMAGAMGQQACLQVEANLLDASTPAGLLISTALARRSSTPAFLAVGQSCTSWSSTDGKTWEQLPNNFLGCDRAANAELYSVAYGNGIFVVVGSTTGVTTGCGIWTGKDGRTWQRQSCSFSFPLRAVGYSSSLNGFVAVGTNTNGVNCDVVFSSPDGNTWNTASSPPSCAGASGAVYALSVVPLGSSVMSLSSIAAASVSTDRSAWTAPAYSPGVLTTRNALVAVAGPRAVALGFSGGTAAVATSSDLGLNPWTSVGASFTEPLVAGAYGSSTFVSVATNCRLARSTDGMTSFTSDASFGGDCASIDWTAVAHSTSRGLFVAGGKSSTDQQERFAYSATGASATWTIVSLVNGNRPNAIVVAE